MFIDRVKRASQSGFTLLEIMLAVGILAMMSLAIYRFVQVNISALVVSSEIDALDAQYTGFVSLISSEWQALPPGRGALLGEPLKLSDQSRDEVTWTTTAGPGLLTRYAPGEYLVSLRLKPDDKGIPAVGLERKVKGEDDIGSEPAPFIPLLTKVDTLQIRYFDPRLNTWVDKWTDTVTLPRLVRLTIGRPNDTAPWEAVIALGRTPL